MFERCDEYALFLPVVGTRSSVWSNVHRQFIPKTLREDWLQLAKTICHARSKKTVSAEWPETR